MTPGAITAQGQAYLRRTVEETQTKDGTLSYLYPLMERRQIAGVWGDQAWLGIWSGETARKFYHAHWATLKAGQALDIHIERINPPRGGEHVCVISSMRLAAPRKPAAESGTTTTSASTSAQPQPEPMACSADARQ